MPFREDGDKGPAAPGAGAAPAAAASWESTEHGGHDAGLYAAHPGLYVAHTAKPARPGYDAAGFYTGSDSAYAEDDVPSPAEADPAAMVLDADLVDGWPVEVTISTGGETRTYHAEARPTPAPRQRPAPGRWRTPRRQGRSAGTGGLDLHGRPRNGGRRGLGRHEAAGG